MKKQKAFHRKPLRIRGPSCFNKKFETWVATQRRLDMGMEICYHMTE